jgi:hypothetical protein
MSMNVNPGAESKYARTPFKRITENSPGASAACIVLHRIEKLEYASSPDVFQTNEFIQGF